jgi:hypothetical protein
MCSLRDLPRQMLSPRARVGFTRPSRTSPRDSAVIFQSNIQPATPWVASRIPMS